MQRASLPVAQLGTPWVSATPVGARRRGGGQMGASPPSPCFKFLSHVCWRKVGTCNYSCANPSLKMGRGREKKKKMGKKQKAPETDTVPLTLPKLGMCPTQGPPPPKKKKLIRLQGCTGDTACWRCIAPHSNPLHPPQLHVPAKPSVPWRGPACQRHPRGHGCGCAGAVCHGGAAVPARSPAATP